MTSTRTSRRPSTARTAPAAGWRRSGRRPRPARAGGPSGRARRASSPSAPDFTIRSSSRARATGRAATTTSTRSLPQRVPHPVTPGASTRTNSPSRNSRPRSNVRMVTLMNGNIVLLRMCGNVVCRVVGPGGNRCPPGVTPVSNRSFGTGERAGVAGRSAGSRRVLPPSSVPRADVVRTISDARLGSAAGSGSELLLSGGVGLTVHSILSGGHALDREPRFDTRAGWNHRRTDPKAPDVVTVGPRRPAMKRIHRTGTSAMVGPTRKAPRRRVQPAARSGLGFIPADRRRPAPPGSSARSGRGTSAAGPRR